MDIIKQIAEDLKADEGWVPHAYDDATGAAVIAKGFVTLGFGFMIDKRRRGGIPLPVAEFWLNWEIDRLWERLSASLPWFDNAPEQVQRALINMGYQLGVAGLLGFRQTLALLEAGKYADAAAQALRSRWAEQVPNRARRVTGWIRSAA